MSTEAISFEDLNTTHGPFTILDVLGVDTEVLEAEAAYTAVDPMFMGRGTKHTTNYTRGDGSRGVDRDSD